MNNIDETPDVEMGNTKSGAAQTKVTQEQMDRTFRFLDTDHSGFIELNELVHWVSREPKMENKNHEDEAKQLMATYDEDGDGKLSPADFRSAFEDMSATEFAEMFSSVKAVETSKILEMFKLIDTDQDGYVSREEFKDWVKHEVHLPTESEAELFGQIDMNKNDSIAPEELVEYYSNFTSEQLQRVTESLRTRHAERLAQIRAEESKEDNNLQPDDETERKAEHEFEQARLARQPAEEVSKVEQRDSVRKAYDEARNMAEGDVWYVVSFSWWRMWKEFTGYDKIAEQAGDGIDPPTMRRSLSFEYGERPGPIDNSDIMGQSPGELKLGLQEGYDFELVPQAAWDSLREWYGGGPVMPRKVVTIGTKQSVELYPFFLVVVWADSVTGKPNPRAVKRHCFSSHVTVGDMVTTLCTSRGEETKLDNVEGRLWVKAPQADGQPDAPTQWTLVPDSEFKTLLSDAQMVRGGDYMLMEAKNELGKWPRDPLLSTGAESNKDFRDFEIGDNIDAQDPPGKWYQSIVRDVKKEKIFVHYEGWSSKYDEWIPRDSDRLAPLGSKAKKKYQARQSTSSWEYGRGGSREGTPLQTGVVGLQNLGNTCFMNSTLQCMAASVPLKDYIVSDRYQPDLNKDNPLGHMGRVAEVFASLVKDIWSKKYSVVAPSQFKHTISEFAPQFSGFQQHDSSELLSFLLDGLHEDLNRVKKKPYTQDVESKGRPDEVVAAEAWETYRLRNDSFIVDTFTGQLKSTIVCPQAECGKVSIKFDPFVFLSVPLPIPTTKVVCVTHVPCEGQPTVYGVTVPKKGSIGDLKREVARLSGITLAIAGADQKDATVSTMIVADMVHHRVSRTLRDRTSVTDIRERDVVYAFSMPKGTVVPAQQPPEGDQTWRDNLKVGSLVDALDSEKNWYEADVVDVDDTKGVFVHFNDWPHKWNEWLDPKSERIQPKNSKSKPLRTQVCCYHTKDVKNPHYHPDGYGYTRPTVPESFGIPFWYQFQSYGPTNKEVRATLHQRLAPLVKPPAAEAKEDDTKVSATGHPYEIHVMNSQGSACGYVRCKTRGCTGCVLPDDDNKIDLLTNTTLAIKWLDVDRYDKAVATAIKRHESAPSLDPDSPSAPVGSKNLYHCLEAFTKQEILNPEDMWYCSDCKEHRQASKKMDVYRLPKLLIIHLKRFSFTRHWREKLDLFVDFPIEGLDMSKFLMGPPPDGKAPLYDLYGVSNHFGGMGGGHYTAFTRSSVDGKWYNNDDSSASEASAAQIKTRAAYLLFYKLRE